MRSEFTSAVRELGVSERLRPGAMSRLPPKVLEPVWRQLGVAHRVLDVLVPESSLQRPGVVASIGERVSAARAADIEKMPDVRGARRIRPLPPGRPKSRPRV